MCNKMLSEKVIRELSGFGPHWLDLMQDPDASRGSYSINRTFQVSYNRRLYTLTFSGDYDLPGDVYLSRISWIDCCGWHHISAWSASKSDESNYYPIDWAWV